MRGVPNHPEFAGVVTHALRAIFHRIAPPSPAPSHSCSTDSADADGAPTAGTVDQSVAGDGEVKEGDLAGRYQASVSYLEIYLEQVRDLLAEGAMPPGGLEVREIPDKGFWVPGLLRVPVRTLLEAERVVTTGEARRKA